MTYEQIATNLKEIRREAGLTQKEFGEKLSVSQDAVSLWEKGKSLPTTDLVILIAKTFAVSADFLLGLKDY